MQRMVRLLLLVVMLAVWCGAAFAAIPAECSGRTCRYIDHSVRGSTVSVTDANTPCTDYANPCRNANFAIGLMSGDDILVIKDGVYGLFPTREAITSSDSSDSGTMVGLHLDRPTCTDCWVRAETLNTMPTGELLLPQWYGGTFPDYIELARDINHDGVIAFEPRVILDCATPGASAGNGWQYHRPWMPTQADNMLETSIAVVDGTWTVDGIASTCRLGVYVLNTPGFTMKRSIIWTDSNNFEHVGAIHVDSLGDTVDSVVFQYLIIGTGRMNPWTYMAHPSDSNRNVIQVIRNTTTNVAIRNIWSWGGQLGPTWADGGDHVFENSFLLKANTHSNNGSGFVDVVNSNLVRGGVPWGLCREKQFVCYNAASTIRRGANCNGADTSGTDKNLDGVGDTQCDADAQFSGDPAEYSVCRRDPETLSDEWCYENADCTTRGNDETVIFPSSDAHYNEPAGYIASNHPHLITAVAAATDYCDLDAVWCSSDESSGDRGCGALIDPTLNTGDGVVDWATNTAISENPCRNNLTRQTGSCNTSAPRSFHARYWRGGEPGENGDDMQYINITNVGYGYSIASIMEGGTRMNLGEESSNGPICSEPDGANKLDLDCDVSGLIFVNNIVTDLGRYGGVIFWRPARYSYINYTITATNWTLDYNAWGGRATAAYPWVTFGLEINMPTADAITSWMGYWGGRDGTRSNWSTSAFNAADKAAGNALCVNDTLNYINFPPSKTHSCSRPQENCVQQTCATDTGATPNCNANSAPFNDCDSDYGEWQNLNGSGFDVNGMFMLNLPDEFEDYYHFDLMPKVGSVLRDAGMPLATTWLDSSGDTKGPPQFDIFGYPRNSGGATQGDIGAIEYRVITAPSPTDPAIEGGGISGGGSIGAQP